MSSLSFSHSMNTKSPAARGYCFSTRDSSTDGTVIPFNASAVMLIASILSLNKPEKIIQSICISFHIYPNERVTVGRLHSVQLMHQQRRSLDGMRENADFRCDLNWLVVELVDAIVWQWNSVDFSRLPPHGEPDHNDDEGKCQRCQDPMVICFGVKEDISKIASVKSHQEH